MKQIEFYYDFTTPNGYLVHKVLPGIAAKHGATVVYRPALLGGIFKSTNNTPPMQAFAGVSNKIEYQRTEIKRFTKHYDIKLTWNPNFPVNTIAMMRGAMAAQGKEWEARFVDTLFNATWRDGLNVTDPAVLMQVLKDAELPADEIAAASQSQEAKDALRAATDAAVARKIYGMPTMFVGEEMFFGKDSLPWLERELAG